MGTKPQSASSIRNAIFFFIVLGCIGVLFGAIIAFFINTKEKNDRLLIERRNASDPENIANWKGSGSDRYGFYFRYRADLIGERVSNEEIEIKSNATTRGESDSDDWFDLYIFVKDNPSGVLPILSSLGEGDAFSTYENNNIKGVIGEESRYKKRNMIVIQARNYLLYTFILFGPDSQTFPAESAKVLFEKILSTVTFDHPEIVDITSSPVTDTKYYTGEVSYRIPYRDLQFIEIDPHNFKPLEASLEKSDYHSGDFVADGYTFIANKGESFEFLAKEDWSLGPRSYIKTELYGYGPTIIRMGTRIGWSVPVTGRYFYVVKGEDVNRHTSNANLDNKYGKYTLSITQSK